MALIISLLQNKVSNLLKKEVPNFLEEKIEEHLFSYFLYEFKVSRLKKSVERLQDKREIVQHHVEDEWRHGKETAPDVSNWLQQVDDIFAKIDKFWKDKDLPYAKCSNGIFPKPGVRYRLGLTASRLAREVNHLYKASFSDGVSSGLRPMSIDFILSVTGFESFDSRKVVTENITNILKDSTIRMIGVYGLGGVGKTTSVKKVASKAKRDKLFEVVVFANVTRNPDIKKIQGQLADQLGARLDEESEIGRASRLRDIFKKDKSNVLVILDDLWDELDLNKLGIPIDDINLSPRSTKDIFKNKTSKEEAVGDNVQRKKEVTTDFKILLTSRSNQVLLDKMNVKKDSSFHIKGLQEKEAENLFKKVARVVDKPPEFGSLAAKISKKCGGLPIAVVTIGRTLSNKNYSEWKNTLEKLEGQEFTGWDESVEFSTKLSFDHLENEERKSTFLLCAQLGHHPLIMDLVKYCIGLGIFKGFLTVRETHERVLRLIKKLKDSSLLLDSYSTDRFNMHDMIRNVALSIATKEQHFFTMRNEELCEWPHKNEFEKCSVISIHNCDIKDKLPNSVSCPRLKIFHVDSLDPSFSISKSFFEGMKELRALILIGIDLSTFPASIGCLTSLRMLCLERCQLGDISNIGELEKLRILSLSGSKIENLPTKLGQLHELQLLDISNCSKLREILPNVLSSLSKLEELYMRNSLKWGSGGNQSGNDILAELSHMHQLKNLDIFIPSAAILPRNLFLNKLDRYKIIIGDFKKLSVGDFKMPEKNEASRVLALQIKENILIHSQKGIKMLFKRVEKLLLGELKGVQDILYKLNLEGFPCLKLFCITNNSDVKCIVDNSEELSDPNDVFPYLESLSLYNLENMEKISYSKFKGTSFSRLKVIRIMSCSKLKNVFSLSMVLLLSNLEKIEVSDCDSMENIVAMEEDDDDTRVDEMFPKLRSLALQTLPEFCGVYSNGQGGTENIYLFHEQVAIPNLESLELSSINMHKIWSSQPKSFGKLRKLNVENCEEIEYLLSFSMARSLENLKSMSLSGCEKMVRIFKNEAEAGKVCLFSKLEEIRLSHMDKLTSIWPTEVNRDSFPSLKSVFIEHCNELVTVLPSHMVGRYGRLESLKVVDCEEVKEIFDLKVTAKFGDGDETLLQVLEIENLPKLEFVWNEDPERILNFRELQSVEVSECSQLQYLFPVSVARGLQELDYISVWDCDDMEEIVRNVGEEGLNESIIPFVFPKVTAIKMGSLPELKSFYEGRHSVKWPKLKKLLVMNCDKLKVFKTETPNSGGPVFLPEEVIPNLEIMGITLKEAKTIKQLSKNYHINHLNHFCMISCPSDSDIEILYWFLHRIPSLEMFMVIDCDFEILIPDHVTQPDVGNVVQFKDLRLYHLSALKNIGFENDPILQYLEHLHIENCHKLVNLAPSSVAFTHLISLEVNNCKGLEYLMGFSIAKSLVQLKSLKVIDCQKLKEIVVEHNDEVKKKSNNEIVFRKLMTLELVDLRALSCFCSSEIHAFKFPSLEKFIVRNCPNMTKFCKQVTTAPNLQVLEREEEEEEENWYWKEDLNATILKNFIHSLPHDSLRFSNIDELAKIWHEIGKLPLPDNRFRGLRTLVVENCECLPNLIPSNLLPYLENLEELEVRSIRSVVAIFDINDNAEVKCPLRKLTLVGLSNMKHVWNKNPQGILSFENLEIVRVTDCDCLQTLFPVASFAESLRELQTLEIKNCGAFVEIVGKGEASEGEGDVEQFVFPSLAKVYLKMMPEFKHFYLEICPKLEVLEVYDCGKLQIFESESQSYHRAVAEHQSGPSTDPQSIFSVQKPQSLQLSKDVTFKEITRGKIPVANNSFIFLRRLVVENCEFMSNVIPSHLLPYLEKLEVRRCRSVVAIFDVNNDQVKGLKYLLKKLTLYQLPNMKHVWNKNPQGILSFVKLQEVKVIECDSLQSLFPAPSFAKSLSQLEILEIKHCGALVEIVRSVESSNQEEGAIQEFEFQGLTSLTLGMLPELKYFYASRMELRCPCLQVLNVYDCGKLPIFTSESQSYQGAVARHQVGPSILSQSLFSITIQEAISRLAFISLNQEEAMMLCKDILPHLSSELELKYLQLHCFHNVTKADELPFEILHKLPNTETLAVACSDFNEIFPPTLELQPFSQLSLRELRLELLSNLNCIGLEHLCMDSLPRKLNALSVERCPRLTKLVQSPVSFSSLQNLTITQCHGLQYLFTTPTAESLGRLEVLDVSHCESIKEIVAQEEDRIDHANDEMIFRWLSKVNLKSLPSLACFYKGSSTLKFKRLIVLNIDQCSNMKFFSRGSIYAPSMQEGDIPTSVNKDDWKFED